MEEENGNFVLLDNGKNFNQNLNLSRLTLDDEYQRSPSAVAASPSPTSEASEPSSSCSSAATPDPTANANAVAAASARVTGECASAEIEDDQGSGRQSNCCFILNVLVFTSQPLKIPLLFFNANQTMDQPEHSTYSRTTSSPASRPRFSTSSPTRRSPSSSPLRPTTVVATAREEDAGSATFDRFMSPSTRRGSTPPLPRPSLEASRSTSGSCCSNTRCDLLSDDK